MMLLYISQQVCTYLLKHTQHALVVWWGKIGQQPTRMLISAGALRNNKKLIFHLSLFPTCLAFLFYLSIVCPSPYSCVTRRRKIVWNKTKNEETLTMQTRLDGCWRTSLPRLFPAFKPVHDQGVVCRARFFPFSKAAQRNGMFGAVG